MLTALAALASPLWLEFPGGKGPGKGKQIVFLSGDEEYRSEEGLPQLARILSERHGFRCTVLFSIDKEGKVDPNTQDNEPGLEALDKADLCVMLLRFRRWPDSQMKHFVDYLDRGKPVVALRTSTHAFAYPEDSTGEYAKFGWQSKTWPGGFGKQILGESWVSHWGEHKVQGTLAVPVTKSPLLNGIGQIFVTTDVYEAHPPADAEVHLLGQVMSDLTPYSKPATGRKKSAVGVEQELNNPMLPIAWTRQVGSNRVFTTTMGSSLDLENEGLRRLLVNACFWGLKMPIPTKTNVDLVGDYKPSPFGFNEFKKGRVPTDF